MAAPCKISALALGLAAMGVAGAWAAGPDAQNGKRLYMTVGCFACHGTTGAGGHRDGPRLAPDSLPLDAVILQLRHPAQAMPAYSEKLLSDGDIADIHAYLASIPRGKPASAIPALSR